MLIEENISLKPYNSFGIDARARYFVKCHTEDQLKEILASKPAHKVPVMVLGAGSNILLTGNLDKLLVKNEMMGIQLLHEDEQYYYVKAGAGENWHGFVMYCIANGYAGVENLALIPGNVGASPMQNIGAYGVEIKDVFESLDAVHLVSGEKMMLQHEQCAFGYRESIFKHELRNQVAITAVTFRLRKEPAFHISYGAIQQELDRMKISSLNIAAIAEAVIHIRKSKLPDPAILGNAGSFFKNPEIDEASFQSLKEVHPNIIGYQVPNKRVKVAAGWLIEQCGWKGYRRADAGCHKDQALVLVNFGKATGAEIYALSEDIIHSVQEKFGITLQREVNIY